MPRIVTIIGTDGSGKTTLSDQVVRRLSADGVRCSRVWLGAESQLIAPARTLIKFAWMRPRPTASRRTSGDEASGVYRSELRRKNQLATRFPAAARVYAKLAWADYRLQTAVKFRKTRGLDLIVADRYLFDVAVNIGLALGWSPRQVVDFAHERLANMPVPQVRVFLRVTPEVSLARKDDIPDADYLGIRLEYYDAIARAFGFEVLDGTQQITDNADRVLSKIHGELSKPYVHYVHANNTDVGGADRVLASMASHTQSPAGQDIPSFRVSVSLRAKTAAVHLHESQGVPVILYPFVRPQVSGGIAGLVWTGLRTPVTFFYFIRLFRRESPDVVHVNDLYDFLPATAAHLLGVPVVYHIRMIKTNEILRRGFATIVPAVSSASVSVSTAVRSHYFPTVLAGHRACVIHDLGNSELLHCVTDPCVVSPRPPSLPSRGRLVLMVGRIEPWKGQDLFLESVSKLPTELRSGNVFALVGGEVPGHEEYFRSVRAAAERLGVNFLGERADIPALLRSADVSVHCSRQPDPFPGVVVESLLAGAATIASAAGGVPEMISSHETGILTQPNDADALAKAIRELLLLEPSPRAVYGSAARTRALGLVDPRVVDAQIADLYATLARGANHFLGVSSPNPSK